VVCDDKRYPGLWQRWFEQQCAAVGWPPQSGFKLEGSSIAQSWSTARNCLKKMRRGDVVVVQLANHRIGRIGEIVEKMVADDEWNPTVSKKQHPKYGEHGRRVLLRWDLSLGPKNPEEIVTLPEEAQIPLTYAIKAVAELPQPQFRAIVRAMRSPSNWVSMFSYFRKERALSDYVAEFPHRVKDGLKPFPEAGKITEKPLVDGTRMDVLLVDTVGNPVVVECKRDEATVGSIDQLQRYIDHVKKLTGRKHVRGLLLHGGARSLGSRVRAKLKGKRHIQVFQYSLRVDFTESR